jgi:hypothetical protein
LAGLVGAASALLAGVIVTALTQVIVFRKQDKRRWDEGRRLAYVRMHQCAEALAGEYDNNGNMLPEKVERANERLQAFVTAQREGVAFDVESGLPEPMARDLNSRSW